MTAEQNNNPAIGTNSATQPGGEIISGVSSEDQFEQLKKDENKHYASEEDIEANNDLNEIRVGVDLNEPDPEDSYNASIIDKPNEI
jgi:hypothetical protein